MKHFKRITCIIYVLVLTAFCVGATNNRFDITQSIKVATYDVKVEDNVVHLSNVLVDNGTTYVPLREICWELGYYANWEQDNWAVNIFPYESKKINVSPTTKLKDEGVIPDKETALTIGKAMLEKYAGKELEYENEEVVYKLDATYLENEEAWLVIQTFKFKNPLSGGGADYNYFPQIKLNKYTGKVLYINAPASEMEDETELVPFETNNLWGYKNVKGEVVVQPRYVSANQFSEGRGLVRKSSGQNGQYGFVDINGKEVIPCAFYAAYDFCDGAALVSLAENTDDSRFTYIDMNGERLFEKEFDLARNFSQGYAAVLKEGFAAPHPLGNTNQKWSYINKKGSYATELTFEEANDFKDGYAIVKNNGKYGAINDKFEIVVEYQYDKTEEVEKFLKEN